MVVPRLAPNIIPMPADNEIKPADRKDMAMTETSELDCITLVEKKPKQRLLERLLVLRRNQFSKTPPVRALKPSSRLSIPNRNMATPDAISLKFGLSQKPYARSAKIVGSNILRIIIGNPSCAACVLNWRHYFFPSPSLSIQT